MQEFLVRTSHRPRPLPTGRWAMTQRWNDLLFAHWPVPAASIAPLLPDGLQVDTFHGTAWLGVVPFWMDRIKIRGTPPIFGLSNCPELNLRTFVRDQRTRTPGTYSLSMDGSNLLTAGIGRAFYHLPYHWADIRLEQQTERDISFRSRRRLVSRPVLFQANYRGLGPTRKLAESRSGTLEHFLMERYCLFTCTRAGRLLRSNLHQVSSPLEEAEAEIERNDLASTLGIELPQQEPVLYYMRRLAVYIWPSELVRPTMAARPVTVAVTHPG